MLTKAVLLVVMIAIISVDESKGTYTRQLQPELVKPLNLNQHYSAIATRKTGISKAELVTSILNEITVSVIKEVRDSVTVRNNTSLAHVITAALHRQESKLQTLADLVGEHQKTAMLVKLALITEKIFQKSIRQELKGKYINIGVLKTLHTKVEKIVTDTVLTIISGRNNKIDNQTEHHNNVTKIRQNEKMKDETLIFTNPANLKSGVLIPKTNTAKLTAATPITGTKKTANLKPETNNTEKVTAETQGTGTNQTKTFTTGTTRKATNKTEKTTTETPRTENKETTNVTGENSHSRSNTTEKAPSKTASTETNIPSKGTVQTRSTETNQAEKVTTQTPSAGTNKTANLKPETNNTEKVTAKTPGTGTNQTLTTGTTRTGTNITVKATTETPRTENNKTTNVTGENSHGKSNITEKAPSKTASTETNIPSKGTVQTPSTGSNKTEKATSEAPSILTNITAHVTEGVQTNNTTTEDFEIIINEQTKGTEPPETVTHKPQHTSATGTKDQGEISKAELVLSILTEITIEVIKEVNDYVAIRNNTSLAHVITAALHRQESKLQTLADLVGDHQKTALLVELALITDKIFQKSIRQELKYNNINIGSIGALHKNVGVLITDTVLKVISAKTNRNHKLSPVTNEDSKEYIAKSEEFKTQHENVKHGNRRKDLYTIPTLWKLAPKFQNLQEFTSKAQSKNPVDDLRGS